MRLLVTLKNFESIVDPEAIQRLWQIVGKPRPESCSRSQRLWIMGANPADQGRYGFRCLRSLLSPCYLSFP